MLRALARRERRPLWAITSVVLAAAVGLAVWAAIEARREAIRAAGVDAELTAQARLAPLLQPRDLTAPVEGDRLLELDAAIRATITDAGPIRQIRIYSPVGRILYSATPSYVGTRPSYVRAVTLEVADGESRNVIRGDALLTYVPMWLSADGRVAVAELAQAFAPIEAQATGWYLTALVAGALMFGCLAMVVVCSNVVPPRTTPTGLYRPPIPRRIATSDAPRYEHPRFRAIEEQRRDVQRRAELAEEHVRAVQRQLRQTLSHVTELEGRIAVNETQNSTTDEELLALRDQLRLTSERLHKAELDNNALRERMALRQQELEEARELLAASGPGADPQALRSRLEEAELRTAEMAHEIERLESELEYTSAKFHMTKLTEALREFDNDAEIPERDELETPTVIIHDGSLAPPKQQRVG